MNQSFFVSVFDSKAGPAKITMPPYWRCIVGAIIGASMSLLLGAMFVTLYPENVVDGEQVWISPFDVHVTRPGFSGLNIHVQLVVLTIQALVGGLLGTSIGLAMDLRCMLQRLGNCHSEEAISLASRNN